MFGFDTVFEPLTKRDEHLQTAFVTLKRYEN